MGFRVELIWANQGKMEVGQRMQTHLHACHQLYYILEGESTFMIGDRDLPVQAGSCFLVPAMTPHQMRPIQKTLLHSYELKLFIKDPFLLSRLQDGPSVFTDDGTIGRLLTYVVENWNCRDGQNVTDIEYVLSTVLLNFFVEKLHYAHNDSAHILTEGYSTVTKSVLVYIEKYFPYRFSLQTMGERLNYNKNYLCSVFRRDTGVSIVEFLNFIRIRRAIIFFVYYGQDVYTTCESVGFANLSHFSRTFKALVGVPPRDFRRAFSLLKQEDATRYFADERALNYQICTMQEAMASLNRCGQIAMQILKKGLPSE